MKKYISITVDSDEILENFSSDELLEFADDDAIRKYAIENLDLVEETV